MEKPRIIDFGAIAWCIANLLPSFPSYVQQLLHFKPSSVVIPYRTSDSNSQSHKLIKVTPGFDNLPSLLMKMGIQDHQDILSTTNSCGYLLCSLSMISVPVLPSYMLDQHPSPSASYNIFPVSNNPTKNFPHLPYKPNTLSRTIPPALPMLLTTWSQAVISLCYAGWGLGSIILPTDAYSDDGMSITSHLQSVFPLPNA